VINASVGFDETTLQPTFELKIGVPGASAGINIAQRLGLNPAIIDSARSRLGSQTQDVADSSIASTPTCANWKPSATA
jgi:DNA mismatch repair protein MutS2